MNRVVVLDTHRATISIGLQRGYTKAAIQESEVFGFLQHLQDELIAKKNLYLSANCYRSSIVLSGLIEPHLNLQFINYPKFPLHSDSRVAEQLFKETVEHIAARLMEKFDQNRVVIQFHDSNVMLEKSGDIDPDVRSPLTTR
ncbi:MAG: hypothetical protein V5B30_12270 [Candidatus Accumulibacter delftensis]|jgi:hypothetical protein